MLRTSIVKLNAKRTTPRVSKRKKLTNLIVPSSAKTCRIIKRFCHPQYANVASTSTVAICDSMGRHCLGRCLHTRDVEGVFSSLYKDGWLSRANAYGSRWHTGSHSIGGKVFVDHCPSTDLGTLCNSNTW